MIEESHERQKRLNISSIVEFQSQSSINFCRWVISCRSTFKILKKMRMSISHILFRSTRILLTTFLKVFTFRIFLRRLTCKILAWWEIDVPYFKFYATELEVEGAAWDNLSTFSCRQARCTRRCPGKVTVSIFGLFFIKGNDDQVREVWSFWNHFQSISHVKIG